MLMLLIIKNRGDKDDACNEEYDNIDNTGDGYDYGGAAWECFYVTKLMSFESFLLLIDCEFGHENNDMVIKMIMMVTSVMIMIIKLILLTIMLMIIIKMIIIIITIIK